MAPSHAGDEQQYTGWSSAAANNNQPSPGRRDQAVQPPLLTTALGGLQFHHGTTPLSSTSLSSPFIHTQSPCVPSPANARSTSSSRQTTNYGVPYNPQDWGPLGPAAAQAQYPHQSSQIRVAPQPRPHTGSFLFAIKSIG